jgi:hypothetical protein
MEDNRMSLHPLSAEHNAERKLHIFENRSLLDVQFQICGCIVASTAGIAHPIDIDAAVPKGILQTNSIAVSTNTINGDGVGTGKSRRSKEAPAEARTLLIGPVDQPNRDGWPAAKLLREAAQHLKSGKNAQATI